MWGLVAIVKRTEIVDEDVEVGLWLVNMASICLPDGLSVQYLFIEEGLVMQVVGMRYISCMGQMVSLSLIHI